MAFCRATALPWSQITTFRVRHRPLSPATKSSLPHPDLWMGASLSKRHISSNRRPSYHAYACNHLLTGTRARYYTHSAYGYPQSLTAPALTQLTLRWSPAVSFLDLDMSPLFYFMSRSCCRLQSLALRFTLPAETLIRCLKTIPSLVYLEFEPFHPLFLSSLFSEPSTDLISCRTWNHCTPTHRL
ncbi:hypothetical protein R3P38DRAFT_2976125 [Favolaschia claudopus]|uniref:Uncharacterized protein n=1 Tax=Favolaschia claudopus TaxID=2862362 RepID=A0AAW0B027_9AGAR